MHRHDKILLARQQNRCSARCIPVWALVGQETGKLQDFISKPHAVNSMAGKHGSLCHTLRAPCVLQGRDGRAAGVHQQRQRMTTSCWLAKQHNTMQDVKLSGR